MKKFITIALFASAVLGFNTIAKAQGKIGYVSADEIISLMPEAAKIDTQLNAYQQALYQNAQIKQTDFNDAVAKFVKDSVTMSPSVKEVRRADLQKQSQELSGIEQQIQQQMQQKQQELAAPLQKRLQQAIQDVARENGYAYILPREALLVMPPGDDIGNLVKKKLGIASTPPKTNGIKK